MGIRKNGAPDRWEDYCNFGKRIEGSPFVAFKVPLKAGYIKGLQDEYKSVRLTWEKRFLETRDFSNLFFFQQDSSNLFTDSWTLDDLYSSIPDIAAIVDLTNTTRYYDSSTIKASDLLFKSYTFAPLKF